MKFYESKYKNDILEKLLLYILNRNFFENNTLVYYFQKNLTLNSYSSLLNQKY
jgi:hypothetical protein